MDDEPEKKSMVDRMVEEAMVSAQNGWDKCTICRKPLPPGSPMNKLYDDDIGEITSCVGCSLKAVLWYVRNMTGKKKGEYNDTG